MEFPRRFLAVTSFLTAALAAVPALADVITDNFDDGSIDLSLWDEYLDNGVLGWVEQDGVLKGSTPGGIDSAGGLSTALLMEGDFDVQVSYDWFDFQGNRDARAILVVKNEAETDSASLNCHRWGTGSSRELLFSQGGLQGAVFSSSVPLTGALRIRRVGSTITGQYWSNGQWVTLGTSSGFTDPARAYIRMDNGDSVIASNFPWYEIHWDDFYAEADSFSGSCEDGDGDGFLGSICGGDDCDDADAAVFPGADEWCNGVDDDCDGAVDEDDALDADTWYQDADGDDFGDAAAPLAACAQPAGFVGDPTDCVDNDADIFPGAAELCDDLDNDCNGLIDDGVPTAAWYPDEDGDGFGDQGASPVLDCLVLADHVTDATDCDDSNPAIHPDAAEQCNQLDDDCDGIVDEDTDMDEDGDSWNACQGDCDDLDPDVHPGADEHCDGKDNDCDGELLSAEADLDGDGWSLCEGDCDDGDPALSLADADEDGFSTCDGDCDDASADLTPADIDGDGVSSCVGDCDDTDASAYPEGVEICDDGADNDCDGTADEKEECEESDDPVGDDDDYPEDDDDAAQTPEPDPHDALTAVGCECSFDEAGGHSGNVALLCMALCAAAVLCRRLSSRA
jgi:hypothetical protein